MPVARLYRRWGAGSILLVGCWPLDQLMAPLEKSRDEEEAIDDVSRCVLNFPIVGFSLGIFFFLCCVASFLFLSYSPFFFLLFCRCGKSIGWRAAKGSHVDDASVDNEVDVLLIDSALLSLLSLFSLFFGGFLRLKIIRRRFFCFRRVFNIATGFERLPVENNRSTSSPSIQHFDMFFLLLLWFHISFYYYHIFFDFLKNKSVAPSCAD